MGHNAVQLRIERGQGKALAFKVQIQPNGAYRSACRQQATNGKAVAAQVAAVLEVAGSIVNARLQIGCEVAQIGGKIAKGKKIVVVAREGALVAHGPKLC